MADSDSEEFGGMNPTTPLVRVKKGKPSRAAKPSSRADAGPSRLANGTSKRGRNNARGPPSDDDSDIEELTVVKDLGSSRERSVEIDDQPPAKKPRSRSDAPMANGKSKGKGKGKGKAPAKATRRTAQLDGPASSVEIIDDPDDMRIDAVSATNVEGTHTKLTRSAGRAGYSKSDDELQRAREQIAALSQQLEDVFRLRHTDAESMLNLQKEQYEAQLQAQETLIKALTTQLAQKEPLTRTGKESVLHLITREAADEENKMAQEQVSWWKAVAEEKEKDIKRKDLRISELETIEKDLRLDMKAEIERSSILVARYARQTPAPSRSRAGAIEDPKHAEVVRFYEDLTNLLVTNMKLQPGKTSKEDWVLSCIFTYIDPDEQGPSSPRKSLNFTLRFCLEPSGSPDASKDDLVSSVNYIPLELDKEPPEFVEKLGFLGSPFTFGRDQLPLFLRTVNSNLGEATKDDSESDNEGSVQFVG